MKQKKSGSGLIFAIILLFVILAMVVTLSSITVLETKMSQKTKSSVGAFYNSESGVEWALNQIASKSGSDPISSLGTVDGSGSALQCPETFGSGVCKVLFLDQEGKVLATSAAIDQVKAVRSVGSQGGDTQRAIEAAVAAGDWCDITSVKTTSGSHDGNFGSYKAMYNWTQSNGCSSYHVCSGEELACYYQTHDTDDSSGWYNGVAWATYVQAGPAYYVVDDCGGWKNANGTDLAPYWHLGAPAESDCPSSHSVMCCK